MRAIAPLFVLPFVACGSANEPAESPTAAAPADAPTKSASAATSPSAAPVHALASSAPTSSAPASTQTAPPSVAPEQPPSRCPDGMTFVPGGAFKPAWNTKGVTVPDLCVDTTETTAKAYAECVTAGACSTKQLDCAAQATFGKADTEDHPMVCVDFAQANAYCAYRQKRLPTTGEWEWAARGGAEARPFPWGDAPAKDQLCWAGVQKQSMACKVGSYPAGDSAQGVKDLAGNVLEFTTTDNDARTDVRIARGGSWRDGAQALVKNSRLGGFGLSYRCGFLGIRCVQEPKP